MGPKIKTRAENTAGNEAAEDTKELEAYVLKNAKMVLMGELLAGITHEIKNPLSFVQANMGNSNKFLKKIIAFVESYDELDIPEDTRKEIAKRKEEINYDYIITRLTEMLERSKEGVVRINKIVTGISAFSRRDTDETAEADINDAIETTISIISHEHKNRIEIKKEYGDMPPVVCNIGKLNQVFMNLLVNACQAIEDKGTITIKTGMENAMVKVEISDTGCGIPEDVIKKVFDQFYTTKPVGKGTGIGLSISLDIMREQKGDISVTSSEGKGTTFIITFPAKLS